MANRILVLAFTVAALGAGCRAPRPEAPPPQRPASVRPLPPREPARVGDYIVYPLRWRDPWETAFRLHALLYPKYGPLVQVIPDPATDSLWIYLPPPEARFVRPRPGAAGG